MYGWVGEGGGKRKKQGTGSDFRHAPDLTVRPKPKSNSVRRKDEKKSK